MTRELTRLVPLARIRSDGLAVTVQASPAELAALAGRLAIPAVLELTCSFALRPAPGCVIEATGLLRARVVRTCVISIEDFEARVEEVFSLHFVPAGTETDDPDPESVDESPYDGDVLDLGEAAAEQLALALDPYPRAPGAELPEQQDSEAAAHPFAALTRPRGPPS